ncbi:MAG: RNA ligase family protein, partial [Acidimicrobiales bacterium]
MTAPPPYPRIAHLVSGRGTRDDLDLGPAEVTELLGRPVVVEEKLDGANVVVWADAGQVKCALRSGPGAMDRAGQLGPLKAWLGERDEVIRPVVEGGAALYAEWLLLTHSVAYDRLPAYLVVLDLWRDGTGFLGVDERNRACRAAGLATPPELLRGVAGRVDAIEALLGPSAWGPGPMEGLVVRTLHDPGRRAKMLRAGFDRLDDEAWRRGRRPRNRLADQERRGAEQPGPGGPGLRGAGHRPRPLRGPAHAGVEPLGQG